MRIGIRQDLPPSPRPDVEFDTIMYVDCVIARSDAVVSAGEGRQFEFIAIEHKKHGRWRKPQSDL